MKVLGLSLLMLAMGVAHAQQLPNAASAPQQNVAVMSARAEAPPAAGHSSVGTHLSDRSFKVVADKKFWAVTSMMTGSTISAVELAGRCEASNNCKFMGPFDSRAKLYAIGLPVNFGMMELTYRLKRSGKRYWFVPAMAGTAFNTIVAVHSANRLP